MISNIRINKKDAQPAIQLNANRVPANRMALTVAEVAELVGVGESTVRRSIKSDELKSFKLGGRTMVAISELLDLMSIN
jgi:excisionase family DNA binding protein